VRNCHKPNENPKKLSSKMKKCKGEKRSGEVKNNCGGIAKMVEKESAFSKHGHPGNPRGVSWLRR